MGNYCCGCCDDLEETPKILAEYDPLMTQSVGEKLIGSVNSERARLFNRMCGPIITGSYRPGANNIINVAEYEHQSICYSHTCKSGVCNSRRINYLAGKRHCCFPDL